MAIRVHCPRCGSERSWLLKGGRRRCARCRFDWVPGRLPLRLNPQQWRAILRWFARGASSAQIAHETKLDRKRVLRALTVLRQAMVRSTPSGPTAADAGDLTASVDDRLERRQPLPAAVRRTAALGFYIADDREWVEIVRESEVEGLARLLRQRKHRGTVNFWARHRYVAVVFRGRLYRLGESGVEPAIPFGRIEAFWAYLQRQLRARGGIRRERLALYLAEYVWRYHRRTLSSAELVEELMNLVRTGGGNAPLPHDRRVHHPDDATVQTFH